MKVLITGINGFVGKALADELLRKEISVLGTVRSLEKTKGMNSGIKIYALGEIDKNTDWRQALMGVDVVIHLAARVHVMNDAAIDPLNIYRQVNVIGTKNLALQAAKSGVKRFVYLSSIKVNGEGGDVVYKHGDHPDPQDPYGLSKWEAEQVLMEISAETCMEVAVLRPPLVYGPGVKANFLRLMRLVIQMRYLPFGNIVEKRSMVFVDNLISAIVACLEHPDAAGKTFLVSDNKDLSVSELIIVLASAMEVKVKLLPIPIIILDIMARMIGRTQEMNRLIKPLQLDCSAIQSTLNWRPPFSVEEGVRATTRWFMMDGGDS